MAVEWHGDEVMARMRGATMDGIRKAAEHLLQTSSALVPHEEGDLERSGDVSEDEGDRSVAVYYDRPYARRQHEDMTLRHDEGRQAKYLEDPMNGERDTMLDLIAAEARRGLDG